MKKIVIFGYFGFDNFGDEWLLENLKKLIKLNSKKIIKIFVLYNVTKEIILDNDVVYIPRWNILHVFKTVYSVDTVISCGGLFQDETSVLSFLYYLSIIIIAKLFGKKIILLSTEFVIKKVPKIAIRLITYLADYILVRNNEDHRFLHTIVNREKKERIMFCPDICLYDCGNYTNIDFPQKKICQQIRVIGLILKHDINKKHLYKQMCLTLRNNYRLVFIPLHLRQDYKLCLELADLVNCCEVRIWDKVENYRQLFYDIDLIITSRLHGIVISMVLGIPFICVSEEEKITRFVENMYFVKNLSLSEWENRGYKIENTFIYPEIENLSSYVSLIIKRFKMLSENSLI